MCGLIPGFFILFLQYLCHFLWHYHAVLITLAFKNALEKGFMMIPAFITKDKIGYLGFYGSM